MKNIKEVLPNLDPTAFDSFTKRMSEGKLIKVGEYEFIWQLSKKK